MRNEIESYHTEQELRYRVEGTEGGDLDFATTNTPPAV